MSEEDEEDGDSEEKFKREAELEKVKADETAVKSVLGLDWRVLEQWYGLYYQEFLA